MVAQHVELKPHTSMWVSFNSSISLTPPAKKTKQKNQTHAGMCSNYMNVCLYEYESLTIQGLFLHRP